MALTDLDINTALGTNLSAERLVFLRRFAAKRILKDGIDTAHDDYDDLMIFAIGSDLVISQTDGGHGPVTGESVADVSISYGSISDSMGSFKDLPGGGYEGKYQRLLHSNIGHDYLIV